MSGENKPSKLEQSIGDARAKQGSYNQQEWCDRLQAFLAAQGQQGSIVDLKRPDGGASSASMIFSLQPDDTYEPVRRYVVRLESTLFSDDDSDFGSDFGSILSIASQFAVQQTLHQTGLPIPAALWLDEQGEYLGRAGYVMDFASGEASSPSYFTQGPLSQAANDEQRFDMLHHSIDALADFHAKATSALQHMPVITAKGQSDNCIASELNLWLSLATQARPALMPFYQPIAAWLTKQAPAVTDAVIVHADYQGSNVLWLDNKISAILDLESVRLGPREHDVAYQYAMDELSARFFDGLEMSLPSLAERTNWYEIAAGVSLQNMDYHHLRAAFQLACSAANLARDLKVDLVTEPTVIMDYLNRQVLALLHEQLPSTVDFNPKLPVLNG